MSKAPSSIISDARDVTKHPLPAELETMSEDETICKFCGISYLIHRQVRALQDEKEFLESQLRRFKDDAAQANALRDRIRNLEADQEIAGVELLQAQEKVDVQQRALADVRQRTPALFQSLRMQLQWLREEATSTGGVDAIRDEVRQHTQVLASRCARLEREKRQLEDMNRDNAQRAASLSELQDSYTRSREELEALQKTVEQQQRELQEAQSVRTALEEAQSELGSATAKIGRLEAENASQGCALEERERTLRENLASVEKQLAAANAEAKRCRGQVAVAERQSQIDTAKQSRLANSCAYAAQALGKARSGITHLQHKNEQLTADVERLTSLAELHEKRAIQHERDKQEAQEALAEALAHQRQSDAEKQDALQQNQQLKHQLNEVQELCRTLETKTTRQRQETSSKLTDVIAQLKKQLQADKERYEKELKLASHRNANLAKQAEAARDEAQKLKRSVRDLEQQLEHTSVSSSEQVLDLQHKLAEREQKLEDVTHRLELALQNVHDPTEAERLRQALAEKEEETALLQDTVARECTEREELVKSLEAAREQVLHLQRPGGRLSAASSQGSRSSHASTPSSYGRGQRTQPPRRVPPLRSEVDDPVKAQPGLLANAGMRMGATSNRYNVRRQRVRK